MVYLDGFGLSFVWTLQNPLDKVSLWVSQEAIATIINLFIIDLMILTIL